MIRKRVSPRTTTAVPLTAQQRAIAHMAASILLDYPDSGRRAAFPAVAAAVAGLPEKLRLSFGAFLDWADRLGQRELEAHFTGIFDMKRKCCLYLTYYGAGDTRRRGMALVRFREAYRAAGWEATTQELPDYLPMVLEFSAASGSQIAADLLSSHRDGIEVLRAGLETFESPYSNVVDAICLSLPDIDDETRERYRKLVNEGPPAETVGMNLLGNLRPFAPAGAAHEEVRA